MVDLNNNNKEIFKIATESYQLMLTKVSDIYDRIFVKIKGFSFTKAQVLAELDCFVQAILVKIALADHIFHYEEMKFIYDMTEYADLFTEETLKEYLNGSEEAFQELTNLVEERINDIPAAIMMAGAFDQKSQQKKPLVEEIVQLIATVAGAFTYVDGNQDIREKEMFLIGIAPVLQFIEKELGDQTTDNKEETPEVTPVLSYQKLEKLPKISARKFKDVKNEMAKALIYLETIHEDFNGIGSGFIISPDGYAITCAHVTKGTKSILARLSLQGPDGPSVCCPAEVVQEFEREDLALIKLDGYNLPYMKLFGKEKILESGDEIFLMGYPFGKNLADSKHQLNYSVTKGFVTSRQVKEGIDRVMLDIDAKAGHSGGPIIKSNSGEVVGILLGSHVQGKEYKEEMNYMRPVKYIWEKFTK